MSPGQCAAHKEGSHKWLSCGCREWGCYPAPNLAGYVIMACRQVPFHPPLVWNGCLSKISPRKPVILKIVAMPASYSRLPNELILNIAENLNVSELYALVRANRRSAVVLLPLLLELACEAKYAREALANAIQVGNTRIVKLLLYHGIMDSISRYNYLRMSGLGRINRRPPHTTHPIEERSLLRDYLSWDEQTRRENRESWASVGR